MCMNFFFFNPLIHTDFIFWGYVPAGYFSFSNVLHVTFLVDRLVKRHPL